MTPQSRQAGPPPKRSFVPEMFFLCLLLLVVLVAIRGKKENVRVADAWIASVAPLLRENFVSVGYQTSYLLMKAYNIFEIYCTGRRNCFYLHGVLQCLPRQCLWRQYFLRQFFKSNPEYTADSITLEVLLPHSPEPSVVALCRRADQKRLNDNWDLREFGKLRTSSTNTRLSQLPGNLVAFSDTSEALDATFLNSKNTIKALNACSSYFRYLYISDICLSIHPSVQPTALSCTASRAPPPASDKTRRILRMSFFLPPPEKMAEVEPLLRLLFFLTDSSRQLNLSDKTVEVARKMRMQYQKDLMKKQDAQRLEQMEKKRSEKKRQEEERFERMTPEQQRKFEEKEYKKSLKQKGRFKVFKVG
ncbi:transmembrane protein [Cystoisospora suis]|uniref:Transmembrane protein n=1 Tax=Cystoisospora suis TaxID=483139 RepID=A0A2C6LDC7_9APIC|nr:transmembrane protein [Cystoisospora suis]